MIKIILFLAIKFEFVKSFIERLFAEYDKIKKPVILPGEDFKEIALKNAQEDLKRVNAYEKYGEESGYPAPIIARPGRK